MAHYLTLRSSNAHLLVVSGHPDPKRFQVSEVDLAARAIIGQWEDKWPEGGDEWSYCATNHVAASLSWEKEQVKLFDSRRGKELNGIKVAGALAIAVGEGPEFYVGTDRQSLTFGFDGRQREARDLPGKLLRLFPSGCLCATTANYYWVPQNGKQPLVIGPACSAGVVCAEHRAGVLLLGEVAGSLSAFELEGRGYRYSLQPPSGYHPTHCGLDFKARRVSAIFGALDGGSTSILQTYNWDGELEEETKLEINPACACYSEYLKGFVTGSAELISARRSLPNVRRPRLEFLPVPI